MRALLFDRPEEHQTTEPIYLLNRLTKSAHYDATMWLLPTPPNPIASPQKRGRPTHGDPSQVPSPEETQTMRPRHSISPPTASSPFELDENQGYEDAPDHESPDHLTNHTQPRPTSPTPLPQLQPFSNQGALMPPPPLPPIQATENPRPIHQITTLPRRLSPNPLANPPSPPITLAKSPPLIKPQPPPTETMHEPKNPATGNPPHPNVSEIQPSISSPPTSPNTPTIPEPTHHPATSTPSQLTPSLYPHSEPRFPEPTPLPPGRPPFPSTPPPSYTCRRLQVRPSITDYLPAYP
jgi:hypothetical protein